MSEELCLDENVDAACKDGEADCEPPIYPDNTLEIGDPAIASSSQCLLSVPIYQFACWSIEMVWTKLDKATNTGSKFLYQM
ncbi:hypothetical protein ZIOFF_021874 [Zingiber officinale]|uniref:Uncharacterized protein n=1 Tax=Zingiber officinale TaxID=94328 RepID=A0A8J5H7L2_ZINOF|nr:hypothetical protein ZIOFF_021874 [Zingiber officinale]